MKKPDWEKFWNHVADRVFFSRDRLAKVRWPGRDLWRRLAMRQANGQSYFNRATAIGLLRQHARSLGVVALVALIASGGLRAIGTARANPPKRASIKALNVYYFDLGTGQLYTAPSTSPVPMPAPSGELGPNDTLGGVRAHVYACHSCADPKDRFIAYLETGDTAPASAAPAAALPGMNRAGRYYSRPGPDFNWRLANSPDGLAILHLARDHCSGEKMPQYCTP